MMQYFNNWDALSRALPRATAKIVHDVAFGIRNDVASSAPIDTGFLRSSAYAVTAASSSYGTGKTATYKTQFLLPEVAPPTDDQTAYVAVGADYGIFVEMGTTRMPAQPYFFPACARGQVRLDAALGRIEDMLQIGLTGSVDTAVEMVAV